MSTEPVMPSNHLILCCSLLFLLSIFPSSRVFSNELALCIRSPKYWNFSFSISPSSEYSGLSLLALLWNSALSWVYLSLSPLSSASLLSSAICQFSLHNHFAFLKFFFWWFWSVSPVQCYEPPSIILQALCLPVRFLESVHHLHCIIIRNLGPTWMA